METTKRIFRHSFGKLAMMFLGVLMLGYAAFFIEDVNYFLLVMTGLACTIVLFYAMSSVRISDADITTTRLLGTKSLSWLDISHVSMRGQALRLHSRDDDVVLSIDSQLDGYTEILDTIFSKRPDLFDVIDNEVMSRGLLSSIAMVGVSLAIMGSSVFIYFIAGELRELGVISTAIFFVIGVSVLGSWFFAPQSILLEDRSMVVLYLFKEVTYSVDDIKSITLERRKTRNGYIYFVQVSLKTGKSLKPSGFKLGSALMYQILKRWHEKANTRQQINSYNQS